jgi:hypothetical protein
MTFQIYGEAITRNMALKPNPDGTITVTNAQVQIMIVGSPADKFIQTDMIPPFNIPATETTATQPAYIEGVALAYIAATYPNT